MATCQLHDRSINMLLFRPSALLPASNMIEFSNDRVAATRTGRSKEARHPLQEHRRADQAIESAIEWRFRGTCPRRRHNQGLDAALPDVRRSLFSSRG